MAATRTLAQLRTEFLDRGGYRNSTKFGDALVDRFLNAAIEEVWDILIDTWSDYYLIEDTSISTVSGTETVFMPSAFYKLQRLEKQIGGRWRKIHKGGIGTINSLRNESGEPQRYALRGKPGGAEEYSPAVVLGPVPNAIFPLRITYIPVAQKLEVSTDAFDGINGYEGFVLAVALLHANMREGKNVTERQREVDRLERRVKISATTNDAGEPIRLSDHVEGGGTDDGDEEGLLVW